MTKPTLVYATTLAVCAGGLWGILRAGADLSPVADLSGEWKIDGGPLGPGGPAALGTGFAVEQSGRFLRLKFKGGQTFDLTADHPPTGAIEGPVALKAAGGGSRLTGTLQPDGQTVVGSFSLTGPTLAQFTATRVPPHGEQAHGAGH